MKKTLIYFVCGLLLGGGSGSCIAYICAKKHYESVVNKELEKIKESNLKGLEQAKNAAVDDILKDHVIMKKPTEAELAEEEKILKEVAVKNIVDYTTYASPDDAFEEEDDVVVGGLYPVEDEAKIPYVIDEGAIDSSYDIVCLTYFEKDRTLSDDASAQIVIPEDTVSTALLDEFIYSDEDQIYICKDSQSTVYEITRYSGSYSEEVLGLPKGGIRDEGGGIDT